MKYGLEDVLAMWLQQAAGTLYGETEVSHPACMHRGDEEEIFVISNMSGEEVQRGEGPTKLLALMDLCLGVHNEMEHRDEVQSALVAIQRPASELPN